MRERSKLTGNENENENESNKTEIPMYMKTEVWVPTLVAGLLLLMAFLLWTKRK